MNTLEDDEIPQLPSDTLAILQDFLKQKQKREEQELTGGKNVNFEEDWQLSQFWYSDKTKFELTKICQHLIRDETYRIGLLSCPSLYASIKEVHSNVKIFEFDRRFASYGDDFVFYDFNEANTSNYLEEYENYFDFIIVDPPFLSEDCIEKVSKIVRKLIKNDNGKILFCTGEICKEWIEKFLNLKICQYKPEHQRNLGNEFASYSNFELDDILGSMNK